MKKFILYPCCMISLFPVFANAQQAPEPSSIDAPAEDGLVSPQAGNMSVAPETLILNKITQELKEKYRNEIYVSPSIPSLMFTSSQQSLLREAKNGFSVKMDDAEEAAVADEQAVLEEAAKVKKNPGDTIRTISLGGIVFTSSTDWTIWLNKKLIAPGRLPKEIVDLRVYKDYVELKWLDEANNQIYPIRLRPNQTFNLDAKIFTPG